MEDGSLTLQRYLDDLQSQGQYWFLRSDIITYFSLSSSAFKMAMHRLKKKMKVARVRREFYIIIPPEHRAVSSLPASWFIDVLMLHLKQVYYVGLLTAASLHGAAHQQSMAFQVVTNKAMRAITIGQVYIEFITKQEILPQFYAQTKTTTGEMNVSTPEITVFDLIRYMKTAGHINNVATILCELAESLNSEVLAELVKSGHVESTTAQRLGYLLEQLSLSTDTEPMHEALKKKNVMRRLLVVGSPDQVIEYNQRWHILVNEHVEPDEL